jgi:phage terminase large subunit GpA-like protein
MMDANMRIARMARKLGMKARGTGIDGIFVGRRCRFSGTVRVTRWGMRLRYTDHPAVTTAVESR